MITCRICQMPLSGGMDTFGPQDFPLCWYDYSTFLGDDEYDFFAEKERVAVLQMRFAGPCPRCQTGLEIGVADYSVGRTCPACGYHDVTFLYPEH